MTDFPMSGPMYSLLRSKGNVATNVAVPVLAAGGWPALSLRRLADAARITPQAVAAWFPTVSAMRTAVGAHYGERWIVQLQNRVRWYPLQAGLDHSVPSVADLAIAALPRTELEEAYDRVWLTVLEAAQWDDTLGQAVAEIEDREREHFEDLVVEHGGHTVRDAEARARVELVGAALVTAVRGVRAARCSTHHPMTVASAEGVLRVMLGPVSADPVSAEPAPAGPAPA